MLKKALSQTVGFNCFICPSIYYFHNCRFFLLNQKQELFYYCNYEISSFL